MMFARCGCGWVSRELTYRISAEVVAEDHALRTGHWPTVYDEEYGLEHPADALRGLETPSGREGGPRALPCRKRVRGGQFRTLYPLDSV